MSAPGAIPEAADRATDNPTQEPSDAPVEPIQPPADPRTAALVEMFAVPVTGPAYRGSAKFAAVTTVLSIALYGLKVIDKVSELPWTMSLLIATAMLGVVVTTWYILNGHTTVDSKGIRQEWLAPKDFTWTQIVRARHVRLPFTSRLMFSVGMGPMKSIQSGTPELDAAFRKIASHYKANRPSFRV